MIIKYISHISSHYAHVILKGNFYVTYN